MHHHAGEPFTRRALTRAGSLAGPLTRRRAHGGLAAAVVLLLFLGLAPLARSSPFGSSLPDRTEAEARFAQKLNQTRHANRLPMLEWDEGAARIARRWSQTMADENRLYHNPDLSSQVSHQITRDWTRLGENVGYGDSVDDLHEHFWNSPPHRRNILGDYNRLGVGVVVTDRIWVTFVFLNAPGVPEPRPCGSPGYVLDGYGAVHAMGGAPQLGTEGYWNGWNIARDVSLAADGRGGQKLDGFGGLWPVGDARRMQPGAYWSGHDVARALAVTPDGTGAYVLDAYGGVHAAGTAPARTASAYWSGWAIARDIVVDPVRGDRGYVLDGYGGLHPFGGLPQARLTHYFGRDAAVAVVMTDDGRGGYVVDRDGGMYPFAVGSAPMPAALGPTLSVAGGAVGAVADEIPTVVGSAGGEAGAAGSGCARAARWPGGIARAAVARP